MNIQYRLSKKIDERGYQELLIFVRGHRTTSYAKTGIIINSKFVNPAGLIDFDLLGRKRLATSEVTECRKSIKEFEELKEYISIKLAGMSTEKDMLKKVVDEYRGKVTDLEIQEEIKSNAQTLAELSEQYLSDKGFNDGIARGFRVIIRAIMRFETFVQKTNKNRADYAFDVDTITKTDLDEFCQYLANEKELSKKYPKLFASMLITYYVSENKSRNIIEGRGNNTIVRMMKCLKGFFTWLRRKDITKNNPFDGYELKGQVFGEPNYITVAERQKIAMSEMPSKSLEIQKDVFVFHCLIGCRVSDLVTLTKKNIVSYGDSLVLQYVPKKTHNINTDMARVPLTSEAIALIQKYEGVDRKGRLLPFISPQKYNEAIKEIFKNAGVSRIVSVRNSLTGETEYKPIYEVASSHMARRTFVGNAYLKVQDPNLIGAMSGHVEGSREFKRYRKIETETLINTVKLLED